MSTDVRVLLLNQPIADNFAPCAFALLRPLDLARRSFKIICLCQPCSEFEQDAIGVLQECYEENETLSQTLLVKELESFGHLTALDLAVMAEDQNFIAHVSCQELLTRLWMGTMAMNTRWWKVRELYFVTSGG